MFNFQSKKSSIQRWTALRHFFNLKLHRVTPGRLTLSRISIRSPHSSRIISNRYLGFVDFFKFWIGSVNLCMNWYFDCVDLYLNWYFDSSVNWLIGWIWFLNTGVPYLMLCSGSDCVWCVFASTVEYWWYHYHNSVCRIIEFHLRHSCLWRGDFLWNIEDAMWVFVVSLVNWHDFCHDSGKGLVYWWHLLYFKVLL